MSTTSRQPSLPGILGAIDRWIGHAESLILAVGVLLMALNTIANVVGRFVFGESLFFAEEVNRILIVMITFAGIGYAARHGRHIRMSAFYDLLPVTARRILMIAIATFTAMVMFSLCYFSIGYIASTQATGRLLPTLGFPIYLIYLWVPVGFAVTGIQYSLTAYRNATSREAYLSTHVIDHYQDVDPEKQV
ncbi:TRAP transporter small permease [Desulfurispirillum indicum]|uniref:Tripartite ATP-independent periplasmic transporter DctQ component n=1 Tax=Desulfurispirillum indicum (strain ATCC BAA-1389 / DSM 22839 / S5) TaxID=653733 RepID=E6W3Z2_DESIS|nr:TRAP transporter small permease [Desulfurispirillum indicum]ADU65860.1 Tripartite ATP-independent periplasmic transporter DctQ component [Desulfurispirillum indicum S5]UCZ57796.1 TRAP transporter small permease [Desulfurispirillum indicum]